MFFKKLTKHLFFIIAIAIVSISFFSSKSENNRVAEASSVSTILQALGIPADTGTSFTSGSTTVSMTKEGTNEYLTYLKVSVSGWANISSFHIRKIVGNNVLTLSHDNQFDSAVCFFGVGTEKPGVNSSFLFSQNGTYITTITTNGGITLHAVFNFRQENGSAFIEIGSPESLQFAANQIFAIGTTNVFYSSGGNFTFKIKNSLFEVYKNSFSSENEVTGEITIANNTLSKEKLLVFDSSGNNVAVFNFLVLTKLPTIVFKNSNGTVVEDVVSQYNLVCDEDDQQTVSTLFFNESVLPTLSFSSFSMEEKNEFSNYLAIKTTTANLCSIVLNSNQKPQVGNEITFRTVKNYRDYFLIKKGSDSGPEYILPEITPASFVYTFEDLFFKGTTGNELIKSLKDGTCFVICKQGSTINAAFKFTWVQYTASEALSLEESGGGIFTLTAGSIEGNRVNVPIDVTITTNGQVFSFPDIFSGQPANVLANSIRLTGAGSFLINVKYRDAGDNSDYFNRTTSITNPGPTISVQTLGNAFLTKNQISSQNVKVSCTNSDIVGSINDTYDVYFSGKLLGTYPIHQIFTTANSGTYKIVYDSETFSFTVLTTVLNQYSVSAFENITPIRILREQTPYPISSDEYTLLRQIGTYSVTNRNTSTLEIISFGENQTLTAVTENTYQVKIDPITFTLLSNIANGSRTAKNIVLQTINANGNWTISIEIKGKVTTYTKSQFNTLSQKARTLSENGTYTLTLTDADGNSFSVVYTKYYELGTIVIVLIVIAVGLIAFGIIAFVRVRGKTRVK